MSSFDCARFFLLRFPLKCDDGFGRQTTTNQLNVLILFENCLDHLDVTENENK